MLKSVGFGMKNYQKAGIYTFFAFLSLKRKNLPMRIKRRQAFFQLAGEQ
jgi:hypothetical protein